MISSMWRGSTLVVATRIRATEEGDKDKVNEAALGVKPQATSHTARRNGGRGWSRSSCGRSLRPLCPQPRRRRRKDERYERGRGEGHAAGGGQLNPSHFHAGCLLSTILLGKWPDEGQPSAPR